MGERPANRHVVEGDLNWLEYAIADYVAQWGTNFTGQPYMGKFGPNIAGLPVAVANMAMTVIRKNVVASWHDDSYAQGHADGRVPDGWRPLMGNECAVVGDELIPGEPPGGRMMRPIRAPQSADNASPIAASETEG